MMIELKVLNFITIKLNHITCIDWNYVYIYQKIQTLEIKLLI